MSFIGSMFDSSKGAGFQAGITGIQQPANTTNVGAANAASQEQLANQQQFLNSLQAQGGLANQASAMNQMQGVTNQLQGVANGTGPNPAQAMLAQSTGANVANQAALMASQRGAGANVGMLARQAGQQGAATQQQSAGQAATMQANQSLNALGQMGQMTGMMGQMANTQVGQQAAAQQAAASNTLGYNQAQLAALQGQNQANVSMQGNANTANAGIAQGNQAFQTGQVSGAEKGIGAAMMADGGEVGGSDMMGTIAKMAPMMAMMADGGAVSVAPTPAPAAAPMAPQSSFVSKFLSGDTGSAPDMSGGAPQSIAGTSEEGASSIGKGIANQAKGSPAAPSPDNIEMPSAPDVAMAKGGKVPVMVSPGERYLPKHTAKQVAAGKKDVMKSSLIIPGKAKVAGDSYANDTVPKKLEAGGIVIPRSVLQSSDPHKAAAKFVAAVLAKSNLKKK